MYKERGRIVSCSVVDPEWFFSGPDATFHIVSDPSWIFSNIWHLSFISGFSWHSFIPNLGSSLHVFVWQRWQAARRWSPPHPRTFPAWPDSPPPGAWLWRVPTHSTYSLGQWQRKFVFASGSCRVLENVRDPFQQCCRSVTLYGSGSTDPYFWLTDPASDHAFFFSDHQIANNKLWSFFSFFFFEGTVHLHHFSKIKSHKGNHKTVGSRFFLLFLLDDRRIRICTSD